MFDCILVLVTKDHNEQFGKLPDLEEVKKIVFLMNGDSASGPDGSTMLENVGEDVTLMIRAFFVNFPFQSTLLILGFNSPKGECEAYGGSKTY